MEEKITGLCPHCGKRVEIPGGLERFSCLYSGARMSRGELLPREIQAPQAAQDAYQRLRLGLPGSVTGYLGVFRHLTKQEYPRRYGQYLEENRELFQCLASAAQDPGALARLAENLVQALGRWSAQAKTRLTGQDALLDEAKYTICLLLVPALRAECGAAGEAFCRALREAWLKAYPKKPFQLTTYPEIVAGFRQKKLCFITTAACTYLGKGDRCPELTAFRRFRDGYLANQPQGPERIRQYYAMAPGIVLAIDLADRPEEVYPALWAKYLSPCYAALTQGNPEKCLALYTAMVAELAGRYQRICKN